MRKQARNDDVEMCSLTTAECARNHIDFVPRAYVRQPLPLREERSCSVACNGVGNAENAFETSGNQQELLPPNRAGKSNKKQTLLRELVGQPENLDESALPLKTHVDDTVAPRLSGTQCDASRVPSPRLLAQLVSRVFLRRTDPGGAGCVDTVDLSHTALGPVGPQGPSLAFDAEGNPLPNADDLRFFPDERRGWERRNGAEQPNVAVRSLALAYVAPLLWVPGNGHFRVTTLKCHHCHLGDQDAKAIAFILRKRRSSFHLSVLENIDLSFNNITDDGADALKRAIKYNKHVKVLQLLGNEGIKNLCILETIQKRLQRNEAKQENLNIWLCLKWMLKGY